MEILEIKQKLRITAVLAHYGLTIKRGHVCCPFHEDKTPSMKVYRDSDQVRCFSGNCRLQGQGIDVIDFVMEREQISKHEAIVKCKQLLGWVPPAKPPVAILPIIWKSLHQTYKRRGERLKTYVENRGLTKLGELGFNNGRWHQRQNVTAHHKQLALQANFLLPSHQNAKQVGSWARDCLMFPLKNKAEQVVSLYGRSIEPKGRGHYYLKGGTKDGLYPGYPDDEARKLIVTESVIDAASLLLMPKITEQYAVLAAYGTNGFTKVHRDAVATLPELEEVVIMFDGDAAGAKASAKLVDELAEYVPHATLRVAQLPEGTDVNELWANHLSEKLFLELLEEAKTVQTKESEKELAKPTDSFSLSIENTSPADVKVQLRLEIVRVNLYIYRSDGLKFEVLGGVNLNGIADMKCTLRVSKLPTGSSRDKVRHKLDLYHGGQVKGFEKQLHEQLNISYAEARRAVSELIEQLETYREQWQERQQSAQVNAKQVSAQRRKAAALYLKGTELMERTWDQLGKVGIVGERASAMILYLCYSSRKLQRPLHVINFGTSGSGKTHLQESVAALIPPEEVINVTSLSDRALYYYGESELKHKLFVLEDLDGISEEALYALRELMSKGKLSRHIPEQDRNGKRTTRHVEVEGPICFSGCTTQSGLYEDNANRCLLLHRDESAAQQQAVMKAQRQASAGKVNKQEQAALRELFQDVQRALQPVRVVNPYAEDLALPEGIFKPLRTNAHYLQFIEVVTFYHQYQRERFEDEEGVYIKTTIQDIEWANKLMRDVLLRKVDELNWRVRAFFEQLKKWLAKQDKQSFTAKEFRRYNRIAPTTLNRHLRTLVQYGAVEVLGGHPRVGYEYALTGLDDYQQINALIDETLKSTLIKIKKKYKVV